MRVVDRILWLGDVVDLEVLMEAGQRQIASKEVCALWPR